MIITLLYGDGGSYSHRSAHRIVELEAQRAGFDTIDVTEAFMRVGLRNLTSELGDIIHPNKTGQGIMADLLFQYGRADEWRLE